MELRERKRPPPRIYSAPASSIQAFKGPRPPSFAPSSLQVYSSLQALEITGVDLRCQETPQVNHTERLPLSGCETLTRRGNTLILKITTSVDISCPYSVSLTLIPVFRSQERFGQFQAKGVGKRARELWLSIAIPPNFPVGKYYAHVTLTLRGGLEVVTHFHHKPLAVLFNPWNPEDDTHLEDSGELQECLEMDVGTIWRGTSQQMVPTKWEYGQYEEHCLDVALYLLRTLDVTECRSAAAVARGITAQVNARDNSGVVMMGGGRCGAGVHPCRWNGSPAILQRFYRSRAPVRYGHCWVFAGVLVTLLRALGIPSRPVTCYEAAHRCSQLKQVDRRFSTEGDLLHETGADEVWVYHVWCEAWMRRDDLPQGYDGWQVLDATSQEKQSGCYRIGPASVRAVREGLRGRKWPYDVEYVTSEVSADTRYLRVSRSFATVTNRTASVAQVHHGEVGTCIVTSSGSTARDITESYRDIQELPSYPTPTSPVHLSLSLSSNSALCSSPSSICHPSPTSLRHPSPTSLHHSSPTSLRHSSPTSLRHSSPTSLRHSSPTSLHHSSPTSLRHSSPTSLRHPSPTSLRHPSPTFLHDSSPSSPFHPSSSSPCPSFPPPTRDCSFELVVNNEAKLGDDIVLTVRIRNNGLMMRTVDGRVVGKVIYHTGVPVRSFLSMQFSGVVSPGQSASVSLPIEAKKYLKVLVEQSLLQFFVVVRVRESKQLFIKVHNFQLGVPQLEVDCPPVVTVGRVVRVRVKFHNVLLCSLSRVLFLVQGQSLLPQRELSHKRLVLPGGMVMVEFPLRPQREGTFTLLASMHCDQLTDVRGWKEVVVTK